MEIFLRQLKTTQCVVTNSHFLQSKNLIEKLCKSTYTCVASLNLKSPLFIRKKNHSLVTDNYLQHVFHFNYSNLNSRTFSTFHKRYFLIRHKFFIKDINLHWLINKNKDFLITRLFHSHSSTNLTSLCNSMASTSQNPSTNVSGTRRDVSTVATGKLPKHEIILMNEAREIFSDAVNSVLPKEMIAKSVAVDFDNERMSIDGCHYPLDRNVYVVGFGKAVLGMARAVDDLIGHRIVQGVVSVPCGIEEEFRKAGKKEMLLHPSSAIEVMEGASDNLPDQPAHEAALAIAHLVKSLGEGDFLLVLISGGGSALLPAPTAPITLSDMLSVTGQMSRGGATITQLNTVRKQLDFLKGGGLATLAYPAQVVSLVLSDIVGDPLDLIASAPTVVDTSRPEECLSLFSDLNILDSIPQSVTEFLREKAAKSREAQESESGSSVLVPKGTELTHVQNVIIGSNRIACQSACEKSTSFGFLPFVLSTHLEGEAIEVGKMFSHLAFFIATHLFSVPVDLIRIEKQLVSEYKLADVQLREIVSHVEKAKIEEKGVCIVAGGETTVTVTGTGKGGRNQEMAVSAGLEFKRLMKEVLLSYSGANDEPTTPEDLMNIVFLSAGTDGQDGPTPAAGGVVGLHFAQSSEGLEPQQYLDNNDSYSLLKKVSEGSNLVHTGLTGTNVMDIQLLLIKPAI